jgi:hypothetical protein
MLVRGLANPNPTPGRKRKCSRYLVSQAPQQGGASHALIEISEPPEFHANTELNSRTIQDHLTYHWIQHFMNASNIVGRRQTGKLMVSREKKQIAYHLGGNTFSRIPILTLHWLLRNHQ